MRLDTIAQIDMLAPYASIAAGDLSFDGTQAEELPDPVAIGAVGGSGTRVMANILSGAGLAMASPLNEAGDAMEWPPLRRLLTQEALQAHSRDRLMRNILHGFESLLALRRQNLAVCGRASWKVPATFLWLEDLSSYFPQMQYVHLVRHGLDMAYSANQNQAKIWSHRFGVEAHYLDNGRVHPGDVLEYWLRANEYVLDTGRQLLGDRLITVSFEDLCTNPQREVQRLFDQLNLDIDPVLTEQLAAMVSTPESLYRYRNFNWQADFSEDQLRRLEALGYSAEPAV